MASTMRRRFSTYGSRRRAGSGTWLAVAFWVIAWVDVSHGQWPTDMSISPPESPRWVLLHNGSVFHGKLDRVGSRFQLQIDERTRMGFDPLQVLVVADRLVDLYEYRRTRLTASDINGRLELVRWCLSQELLDQAEHELAILQDRGVPEGKTKGLRLLLLQGRGELETPNYSFHVPGRKAEKEQLSSTLQPQGSRAVMAPTLERTEARGSLSKMDSVPATPSGVVASVFSFYDQPGFTPDQRISEALESKVSDHAATSFSANVHWTLVQACAGCHFPENAKLAEHSGFALEIPSGPHKATEQQLRHNHEQLMTLVNRQNPGNSRLMALVTAPHASLTEPPLKPESDESRGVVEWIYQLGGQLAGNMRDDDTASYVAPASAIDSIDVSPGEGGVQPDWDRLNGFPSGAANGLLPNSHGEGGQSLLLGLAPVVDPANPYDPEAFNRFFHPLRPRRLAIEPAATPPLPRRLPAPEETPPASSETQPVWTTPPGLRRVGLAPGGAPR